MPSPRLFGGALALSGCLALPASVLAQPLGAPGERAAPAAPLGAAAPLPRLIVQRSVEASDCPDAANLAKAVERLSGRAALDAERTPTLAPVYDIQVFRGTEGYTAIVRAHAGMRQISDRGGTCVGLSEALALTLAILLDSEPASAPLPTPRAPVIAAAPRPSPPVALIPERLAISMSLVETAGVLGTLATGMTGEAEFRAGWFVLGLGALWLPSYVAELPPGEVDLTLFAVSLRACAAFGPSAGSTTSVALCFQPMGGGIGATSSGYAVDGSATRAYFAMGGAVVAQGSILGPLGYSARAGFIVPVRTQAFQIENLEPETVVYESFPVGAILGAGLRLTIW